MSIMFLGVLKASAQTFSTPWISYPTPDSTSQVWFRQTYPAKGHPEQASITITSTGNFDLFVNQYNVSTDVLIPYRDEATDNPIAITYDVTRFLRNGENTIAVWYAPSYPHITDRQIAVSFYGRSKYGQPFSYVSDGDWICRQSNHSITTDGNESIDANSYPLRWKSNDIDAACWLTAAPASDNQSEATTTLQSFYTGKRVSKILNPNYFDIEGDSVIYDFGTAFKGWIRVTIRNAKEGERINIGGLEYICNGNIDEQACRKFSIAECRRVIICGDEKFKLEQIQKVEGIAIESYPHASYRY